MNNQPIWVIGICMDNRVKVTPKTKKILKLTNIGNATLLPPTNLCFSILFKWNFNPKSA